MAGSFRLPVGGQIDRTHPLGFTFDGHELTGFKGDTLAAALLGAGIDVVGRSFKFHRPRGVLTAGIEEPNALLTLGTGASLEPSVRATVQCLREGLVATSQNCWPSLHFDLGRLNDLLHPLLPAGFYNKTFMWPSWHTFEPVIRRAAGLGAAPAAADPDRYEWRNAHCDVLVVGGGVAGVYAAFLSAHSGARVILLESTPRLGGELNWTREALAGAADAPATLQGSFRALGEMPNTSVLLGTTAIGVYDHGLVTALETVDGPRCRHRWWRIRAKRIILACGAFEQPLAFPFNDRPGIMLADAVRHYLNRYAVAAGHQVALVTNNDSAYRVVRDLRAAGITVPCLLDTRAAPSATLVAEAASAGVVVHPGAQIVSTRGKSRIASIEFTRQGLQRPTTHVACDALGMSGGWSPVLHLYCQAGGRLQWDPHHACLVPDGRLDTIYPIGAAAAQFDFQEALSHARGTVGALLDSLDRRLPQSDEDWLSGLPQPTSAPRAATGTVGYDGKAHRNRTWLDFQHDVTVADIDLAVRENLVSIEHVKRYTTAGMSLDQGKTSNLNTLAVLARRTNRTIKEVGSTTFRPMFTPVTLGAIAGGRIGRFYRPNRLLPAHLQHQQVGAHFEDYGSWRRPACYPKSAETLASAIEREVKAVRNAVGLFDASPLGKFLVRGPEAADFLNRIYANTVDSLQPGKVRYGIMLNEQGIIIDDGVCARISSEELWVNTTGAGAARISAWFEEWLQGEWPDLRVVVTDLTSGWATLNLAGPRARDVLACLPSDIDFSREAFPHLHARVGTLCGASCRVLRVSFTGELSYEISVPADLSAALWERLSSAGERFGITPFGVEALLVLRTEKGYLHVGSDTDGTTVPDDIGFGAAVSRKARDFVGRRSLSVPQNLRADRMQLVGLRCIGNAAAFVAGAHLLDGPRTPFPQPTSGYLTSAVASPTLGSHVGLGLLKNGRARMGQTVHVFESGKEAQAEVVNPSHYDAAGSRLHD